MLEIDIDHFLRRLFCFHLQLHLVIMLDRLLFDLKVDAVCWFRRIPLDIHDSFVFKLLWILLDIEANFVLGFFKFIFFHVNFDYGIGLLCRLLLLDIKSSRGLSSRSIVNCDLGLWLLQRLWLNNVDDVLRLSDWLWLLNLNIDLLLRRKRRLWLIQSVDPDDVSVLFCGLGHLRWLGTGRASGTLRALDYRRWLRIWHIIGLDYFVWYIDWIIGWQRHWVVLDDWLCRRRGRRRRWQGLKRQRRYLVIFWH